MYECYLQSENYIHLKLIVSMGYNYLVWCNNFIEGRARVQENYIHLKLVMYDCKHGLQSCSMV